MVDSSWKIEGYSLPNAPYNYYPDLLLEPKHMKLELSIDILNEKIEGTNTITIESNNDDADKIILDAIDFDHVKLINENVTWNYDNEFISIKLDTSLPKGDSFDLIIEYRVQYPVEGLYFSYPDDSYPERPIYVGSDHESERARYWLPAIDHPSIRTSYEFILTSEEHYTILAIGKLLEEKVENGKKTVHWKHDFPCPTYITAIALGELTEYVDEATDAGNGQIPVAYYTSSNYDPEHLKFAFDRTPVMIRWFVEKFKIPFAWDKYFQFSFLRIFGAMENQSLVSWGDFAILNRETLDELNISVDDTNVHEMAHTYFGDMIVVKNWSHAWLKESWATYCTTLYREDKLSFEDYEYDLFLNAQSYFGETSKYIRPIVNNKYHSSWEMFDNHLYPGGAWRIHMLRKMLGDDIFFKAVTDYLETYNGKTVETIDFQRKLEEHSGYSLAEFFDQWILHPKGFPEIELAFNFNSDKKVGTFTLTQKQIKKDENDVRNRPFKLKIDLAWAVNGEIYTKEVTLSQKVHEFTIEMEKPEYVTLDPDHKILFKIDTKLNDKMYQAMLDKSDLFSKINAIHKLAESGKRKNIQFIGENYKNQEYYGIKRQIIKALGNANSRFAIDYLINIAKSEDHPKILTFLPSYLTKYKEKRVEETLIELLDRELRPYAKSATISALGNQSDDAVSTIKSYLDSEDWKYLSRIGAFRALSGKHDSELADLFIEAIKSGNQPEHIRFSLILAIGDYGKWQGKKIKMRIIEELESILRDPYWEIRSVAFSSLIKLESKQSIGKMRKIFGLHSKQQVISFRKRLKGLQSQSSDKSKLADLVERIEKLEGSMQKLDEKIQKMSE